MFCSTIIPTIGRSSLSRAVESVLNQGFTADNFEVIVVNDSGQPLFDADWQRSEQVQIINTNRHNRSVARNTGAALAKGRYLHFLDDDDWILPGAFENFWELANLSKAAWLHGGFRLVDNAGKILAEIQPDEVGNCFIQLISWEWLPLQASLIESKAFFAVGGFASLQSLLGGFEDIDLSRQIAYYYDLAGISKVVASIRSGDSGSTTNYGDIFRQNRQSREKGLNTPGAFTRMRASANASPSRSSYWHARIVYYYLGSMQRNLRDKHLSTAVSRGTYAIAAFAVAGRHIFSASFWRTFLKPHYPRVWLAIQEAEVNLYANTTWR